VSSLRETIRRIVPVDARAAAETQGLLDDKTKPRGSLGRLEELACQVAAIRGRADPLPLEKSIIVMGADHGVAEEGVSAYPQAVTRQMLSNFVRGGAAINVLARQAAARMIVVDMGIKEPIVDAPEIRQHRIGPGTHNFTKRPAMSVGQAVAALEAGIQLASEETARGVTLLGIGEMGIGNTTASSALAAVFTGAPVEEVTGRGTGIDLAGFHRKVSAIRRGLEINQPDPNDAIDALTKVGGFEIAGLCGVVLGGAAARVPVVVDGFIASVAALSAVRLSPDVAGYLIAAHRSVEAGHRLVLAQLGSKPLLDLDLRLGEGTGAALAMGLVEASLRILHEMASFSAAGVTDSGA
jgi:nicotinate-nucleotide--dimethylbenzimidazole phosphoribosyltransferase